MAATPQLEWIDQQIQARLSHMQELADLVKQPIGAAVGRPFPGKQDIELIRLFLSKLVETWDSQPNGLKNAHLRLLLDKAIIWPEPANIQVKLVWRTGLEQELIIHTQKQLPLAQWVLYLYQRQHQGHCDKASQG
jgi:hypothetical protein